MLDWTTDPPPIRIIEWGFKNPMTLNSLRRLIRDYCLSSGHTLLLNTFDFEKIVLDYRNNNGYSMHIPHFMDGVEIREDYTKKVMVARVGIMKG
jgi:hypothetical protein